MKAQLSLLVTASTLQCLGPGFDSHFPNWREPFFVLEKNTSQTASSQTVCDDESSQTASVRTVNDVWYHKRFLLRTICDEGLHKRLISKTVCDELPIYCNSSSRLPALTFGSFFALGLAVAPASPPPRPRCRCPLVSASDAPPSRRASVPRRRPLDGGATALPRPRWRLPPRREALLRRASLPDAAPLPVVDAAAEVSKIRGFVRV